MTEPRTWPALSEAVAIVSARIHGIPGSGLSGDIPAEDVIDALAALLRAYHPDDSGASFLRKAGAGALNPDPDDTDEESSAQPPESGPWACDPGGHSGEPPS